MNYQELLHLHQCVHDLVQHIELYHYAIHEDSKHKSSYRQRIVDYVETERERLNQFSPSTLTFYHHKYLHHLNYLADHPLDELQAGHKSAYIVDTQRQFLSLYHQIHAVLFD